MEGLPETVPSLESAGGLVADFGSWRGGVWAWGFSWMRHLFVWEVALVGDLMLLLQPVILKAEENCWSWLGDAFGLHSVN